MSKRIILCADGTWNTAHSGTEDGADGDTNVRHLYLLLGEDPSQLKYYDSGVGTEDSGWEHFMGGTMGEGLFQKIQDGYAFLAYTWDPGDDIYIFGFSRGAYTARSLAGMIAHFGVPTKNLDNVAVSRVFAAYREADPAKQASMKAALNGKWNYGMTDVNVRMIGVWDTVGALGIPGHLFSDDERKKYGFLHTGLSPCIQSAFHAIALDERRSSFQPTLWANDDGTPRPNDAQLTQVWFPGVHCDVGGSYAEAELSDITLRWMIDNARACGLTFDENGLQSHFKNRKFAPLGEQHESWKMVPWLLAKHRTAPEDAVLSNTVLLRAQVKEDYKPAALTRSLQSYQVATVIPESEIAGV